ncbi:hypothetical protein THTE_1478 [Thermogutta terrifontis]|jgi:hypothetical protein|uniref:Uncharacterized protein n=1 Tax=Thermogutta terrifontis TaxID=1331910 RepID=A0A286RDP4_9BACT|nr:hypothetical protein [Thermogutta terrifontis]ASV74080.1 hypothetical protein THTE_1478 [Thermogutta terrifontis]
MFKRYPLEYPLWFDLLETSKKSRRTHSLPSFLWPAIRHRLNRYVFPKFLVAVRVGQTVQNSRIGTSRSKGLRLRFSTSRLWITGRTRLEPGMAADSAAAGGLLTSLASFESR